MNDLVVPGSAVDPSQWMAAGKPYQLGRETGYMPVLRQAVF